MGPDLVHRSAHGADQHERLDDVRQERQHGFRPLPCKVYLEEALEVLVKEQKKLAFLCGKTMSLEDAPKAYEDFEQRKVTKVVFKMDKREAGQDVAEKVKA